MATIADIITGAAQRYGVDPQALLRVAEIESGLNPGARNPKSSAGGLFQFIDSTAGQYGLADKFDPMQAADAGARLMRDNAAGLRSALGRDPSGAELYLAHQQGLGGARKILGNPNASLADLVGGAAANLNAGAGLTAGQFAQNWASKFGGGLSGATGGQFESTMPNRAPPPGFDPNTLMDARPFTPPSAPIDPSLLEMPLGGRGRQQPDPRQAEQEQRRRALLSSIGEMYA